VAGARFCVACGTPVAVTAPPEPPAAAWPPQQAAAAPPPPERFYAPVQPSFAPPPFMPEQMAPAPPPKRKGSRRGCTLLGCGGLLVVMAAAGYGAYAYFTGSLAAANLPFDLGKLLPGLATPAASQTALPSATLTVPVAVPTATPTTVATTAPTVPPTVTPTPTATATPAPTPTPTPTPVVVTYQKGNQVFVETFTGTVVGWPLASDANMKRFVQDGRYNLQTIPAKYGDWNCSTKPPTLSDSVVEVTVRLEDGPATNAYGILFRHTDDKNFYRLQMTPAGRWEFGRQLDGAWTVLVPWRTSDAIPQGAGPVTVRIVAKGATFAFFANGVQIGAVADPSVASGSVCLAITALGDGAGRFSFDDLTVWEVAK
jgi:hypothetical protein